jgi:hypothetical protein
MSIKRKAGRKPSLLLTLLLLVNLLLPCGGVQASAAATAPANSAVQFLYNNYQQNGFKNSEYSVGAYAFSVLRQAGVDVSGWVYNGTSLPDAVYNAVYSDLQAPGGAPAKLLAQDLAAAQALERADWADQLAGVLKDRQSVNTVYGFDVGDWSIFSNMPAFDLLGRAGKTGVVDAAYAKTYILGTQNTTAESVVYGAYSWGCTWSGTYYPDFMTTAEAIRALHSLDPAGSDSPVQTAISNGLTWLRQQQMDDGSFVAGMDDPVIDSCEAIVTLKTLGIDPAAWRSSAGKTPVDYLTEKALNPDGSLGTSGNAMDATWALSALNSLGIKPTVWRFFTDPNSLTLNQNETKDFQAVWQDAYGQHDVTAYAAWSAADATILSVDNSVYKGRVTARAAGATTVSAVYGGLTASATVTVKIPVSGGAPAVITPGLAVIGMNGELLFGPAYVAVTPGNKWGLTPIGLLDASGLPYHTSDWAWGILVDAIAGQANSGMAGWMYAVNGQIPAVGPEKYSLKDGDRVIWYYSKSMEQQPPKWEELLSRQSGGNYQTPTKSPILPAPVIGSTEVKTFADVTGHWAQKEIEFLTTKGYVYGVSDARFAPDATVTRAEFTVLLARLAGLAPAPAGAARFADIPAAAWYRGMVGAAVEASLVAGLSDRAFGPDKPITREQMAAMLARFLTLKKIAAQPGTEEVPALLARFGDAAGISSWARTAVALSAREGLLTGRANARFEPQGKATRAEAATVLYRLYQRLHQPAE